MSDTVAACPECNAGSVQLNSPGGYHKERNAKRYRCSKCDHRFDTYKERTRQTKASANRCGLAKRLLDADPDEVGP